MFGDSHAERLFNAVLEEYGANYKIFLTWERSCYLGKSYWKPSLGYEPTLCEKKRAVVSDLVKKNFKYIIQSQFWINDDFDRKPNQSISRAGKFTL